MLLEAECVALRELLDLPAHNPSMNAVRQALPAACEVADFCVPVNPYFPTPRLLERVRATLPDLLRKVCINPLPACLASLAR